MEDGDLALAGEGGLQVWHDDREVTRPIHQVTWNVGQMGKGGFDHFMLKEIHEQPEAIRETVAAYIGHTGGKEGSGDQLLPVKDPDQVMLLGCGTSYHAALLGERLLSQLLAVPVQAKVASEFQGSISPVNRGLAIAFSQSGETSDTITAVRSLEGLNYASLAVTNVMGSSLTRMVDDSDGKL